MYWKLFYIFSKIGAFTIGGGYAMIPLVEREVVDKKKLMEREEFLDLIAIAQSAPGVMAVNMAIFTGYKLKGFWGSIVAALACILPSFLIILCIAAVFVNFKDNARVIAVFKGLRPVVVALILLPVFTTAKAAGISLYNFYIPVAAALLIWLLGVSPIYVVLAGGIGAYLFYRLKK